jgi:hypothetical protein
VGEIIGAIVVGGIAVTVMLLSTDHAPSLPPGCKPADSALPGCRPVSSAISPNVVALVTVVVTPLGALLVALLTAASAATRQNAQLGAEQARLETQLDAEEKRLERQLRDERARDERLALASTLEDGMDVVDGIRRSVSAARGGKPEDDISEDQFEEAMEVLHRAEAIQNRLMLRLGRNHPAAVSYIRLVLGVGQLLVAIATEIRLPESATAEERNAAAAAVEEKQDALNPLYREYADTCLTLVGVKLET